MNKDIKAEFVFPIENKPHIIELHLHDNELIGIVLDYEKLEIDLKIQTFTWKIVEHPTPEQLKESKGLDHLTSEKARKIWLKLKLKDTKFNLHFERIDDTISYCIIENQTEFLMQMCFNSIHCMIESFTVEEIDEMEEKIDLQQNEQEWKTVKRKPTKKAKTR